MEKLCGSEEPINVKPLTLREQQILEISNFVLQHQKLVMYLETMLKDLFNNLPLYECVDFERDLETIKTRFLHEGISFATNTLPAFFDAVLRALEDGRYEFPGFKLRPDVALPRFLYGITRHIFGDSTDEVKVAHLGGLYQLCVAFKKLKGPYTQDVLSEQLANFVAVDKALPNFAAPQSVFVSKILDGASDIITEVLSELNKSIVESRCDILIPRPGPGATNTPTEKHERYRPHVLYKSLNSVFPYRDWFANRFYPVQSGRWDLRVGKSAVLRDISVEAAPTSRFKFVHKTYGKPRCICIEQLETQWFQQALRRALVKTIEEHPLTSGFVSFRRQNLNADLALSASIDREMATIDMSAASDRISRSLVERLFSGVPEVLRLLMACSTRVIELPDEKRKRLLYCRKFAPMGSAVCFPVMGLVHFALIRSLGSFFSPPYVEIPDVYVYGDDIITCHELTQLVYRYLPLFGMKLNQEKSFTRSHFRESCGMNAYKGFDITPTRFKSVVKQPPSNQDLISALSYEGALFKKGYVETAKLIRSEILHFFPKLKNMPRVRAESGLLGWIREDYDAPWRLNCARRWVERFQRWEYSVLTVQEVTEKPPTLSDEESFLRKCVLNVRDGDVRFTGGLSGEFQIRRKWLPSPAFSHNDPTQKVDIESLDISMKIRRGFVPVPGDPDRYVRELISPFRGGLWFPMYERMLKR